MYKENEKLILMQSVGVEGSEKFIPEGTEVTFVKAIDDSKNISKSVLVIEFENRRLALPELALRPVNTNTIDILKKFNESLIANRPELKQYHHSSIKRFYYKVVEISTAIFITPFKRLYSKLMEKPKSQNQKDKDLVNELKNLMGESDV